MRIRNFIFAFFLFAIFHFRRRKFEGDPMVEYEANPNSKVLTAFRQRPELRISLVKNQLCIGKIFFHVLMLTLAMSDVILKTITIVAILRSKATIT